MKKSCMISLVIFQISSAPVVVYACTGIALKARDSSMVYGRTLEFAQPLDSEILCVPRNYAFTGTGPDGKKNGLAWKSTYAVVGANAYQLPCFVDGVNEKGLAGGLFYFPEYAQYQAVSGEQVSHSVGSWELLTLLLTTCATIEAAKKTLSTVFVSNVPLSLTHTVQPIHVILHDPTGACMVIEYVKGMLTVHDNPLRVITNSPSFEWHITNLRNYINLSNVNVPQVKLSDISLVPAGQGSGMLGLPGDFTPPSRFVRAVEFSQSSPTPANARQAVDAVFHILNLFDIPTGSVREKTKKGIFMESTQWTSAVDMSTQKYYFHTYHNRTVRMIDLHACNIQAAQIVRIPMQQPAVVVDISPGVESSSRSCSP